MKYVNANIVDAPELIIAHGCNCQGKMNSGVAKHLRHKFPMIFDDYSIGLRSQAALGDAILSFTKSKIIANLLTQEDYGYDRSAYASPDAIESSVSDMFAQLEERFPLDVMPAVAIPKIGCGRGGLDWETQVKPILEELERVYNVEFVVYDIEDEFSK